MDSIKHFINFCKQNFLIGLLTQCLEDDRKKPRIPCPFIFFDIFIMRVLGLPSLYQLDILLREVKAPILYQASDSTFARVVKLMWLHPLRVILKTIYFV